MLKEDDLSLQTFLKTSGSIFSQDISNLVVNILGHNKSKYALTTGISKRHWALFLNFIFASVNYF